MKKVYLLILVLLGIHLFLLVNLKFTAWPEMLSYPYLRNNGYLLYKDMIHPYPPVLTMALSIIYKLFGYKLIVLKVFTWLIILVNDVLIFLVAKKISKKNIFALASLFLYVVAQPFLEGNQLWFDLAIVPTILLSTYCILQKKYFWSGLALGVAVLTKQTAGLFLIVNGLWLMVKYKDFKKLLIFLVGPVILFLVLVLRLITEGAVRGFFNWVLIYPFVWWSKFPGYVQMVLTNREIVIIGLLFLPLILLTIKLRKQLFKDNNLVLLVSSILVSSILVYPRFSFFHFQIALAFISIIFGLTISKFNQSKFFYPLCAIYFLLIAIFIVRPGFKDWGKEARFWGKEEERIVKIINQKTNNNDLVYLSGLHSGLYALSNRLPPKPWTDNFMWYLEIPGAQEKIIREWQENKPKLIISTDPLAGNWYDLGTYRPQKIVDWIRNEKIEISILK